MNVAEPSLHRLAVAAAFFFTLGCSVTATANCAPKFAALEGHTACLPGRNTSVYDTSTKNMIVNLHNGYRSAVSPKATNMLQMHWDEELAMLAQKWADSCPLTTMHDEYSQRVIPGRFQVGQNVGIDYDSISFSIAAWNDEVNDFTFGSGNDFAVIGHYTQVVWAATTLVGCGEATCDPGAHFVYVCNYGPAGNLGNYSLPYVAGDQSCTACPEHCGYNNTLCDCGITCLDFKPMDMDTCTCNCPGTECTESIQGIAEGNNNQNTKGTTPVAEGNNNQNTTGTTTPERSGAGNLLWSDSILGMVTEGLLIWVIHFFTTSAA